MALGKLGAFTYFVEMGAGAFIEVLVKALMLESQKIALDEEEHQI